MRGQNKGLHYGASHLLFRRAEELRKFCTHEEEVMWRLVSGNKTGFKFRRQHPLLFYIADFYCHELKLVIEIDGSIHNREDVKINDGLWQTDIENLGIKVIRFTNQQVVQTPDIVLKTLMDTIKKLQNSSNQSSPLGAGGLRAIIFSAGLGTRFKPWTDSHPKALAIVNGKSLLQRNIEYLQQYGIKDVVVNIHHFPDQIINAIKENNGWGSNVIISDETDEVLETGGGLVKARKLLDGDKPFLSLNVDILTNLDLNKLMAFHQQHKPLVTFGVTNRKSSRVLLFDTDNRLCGWKNVHTGETKGPILAFLPGEGTKPLLKEMAYSCVVIYEPKIFDLIRQKGKFSIMDTYLDLAAEHVILGYDHSGDHLVDVGKPESVAVAETLFP
jgi:N-acetyl-alpha-D-muramate 1-phosphate uridylyltransferase